MTTVRLDPAELEVVRRILDAHLAPDVRVGVFGSRAGGTVKPWSDLDLVLDAAAPLPLATLAALREDFDEAPLRWKVDLVDRQTVSSEFGALIERTALPLTR